MASGGTRYTPSSVSATNLQPSAAAQNWPIRRQFSASIVTQATRKVMRHSLKRVQG